VILEFFMNKGKKLIRLLALVPVFSTLVSCQSLDLLILRIKCEAKGGIWQQSYDEEQDEVYFSCEAPPPPVPTPDRSDISGCMVYEPAWSWEHENFRSSSGTGGVTCNAKFIFKNNSTEPVILVLKTAWDNNAMKAEGWYTYSVQPVSSWETQVSRTFYTDGVTTFDHVLRLLVIEDSPACNRYVLSDDQATQVMWEEKAIFVDLIPCP
jgi:hypothetical protein